MFGINLGDVMKFTMFVCGIALALEVLVRTTNRFSKESKQFFYWTYVAGLGLLSLCCGIAGISQLLKGGDIDMRVVTQFVIIAISALFAVTLFRKYKQQ